MIKDLTNKEGKKMSLKNQTGTNKYAKTNKRKSHGETKDLKGWKR